MPFEAPGHVPPAVDQFEGLSEDLKSVLEVLNSSQLQEKLFPMKVVFIVISVVFLFAIIWFLFRTAFVKWWFLGGLRDFLFPKLFRHRRAIRKWRKIQKGMDSDSADQWKLMVLEAGNLLDEILKNSGYPGENLMERLGKLTKDEIVNIVQLKEVSQVCVDVARDPDYLLSRETAEKVLEAIEGAFKDLNIL